MINKDDLEEARLLGGELVLRWKCPNEMTKMVMSAQMYHELRHDFEALLSTVERESPPDGFQCQLATAMRKRWFP